MAGHLPMHTPEEWGVPGHLPAEPALPSTRPGHAPSRRGEEVGWGRMRSRGWQLKPALERAYSPHRVKFTSGYQSEFRQLRVPRREPPQRRPRSSRKGPGAAPPRPPLGSHLWRHTRGPWAVGRGRAPPHAHRSPLMRPPHVPSGGPAALLSFYLKMCLYHPKL